MEAIGEDISRAAVSGNWSRQSAVVVVMGAWGTDTSNAASSGTSATATAIKTRFTAHACLLLQGAGTRGGDFSVCCGRGMGNSAVDAAILESDGVRVANSVADCDRTFAFYTKLDNAIVSRFTDTHRERNHVAKDCHSPCSAGCQRVAAQTRRSRSAAVFVYTKPC